MTNIEDKRFKPNTNYLCIGFSRPDLDKGEFTKGDYYYADVNAALRDNTGSTWEVANWVIFEEMEERHSPTRFVPHAKYRCTGFSDESWDAGEFEVGKLYVTNEDGFIIDGHGETWDNAWWVSFEKTTSKNAPDSPEVVPEETNLQNPDWYNSMGIEPKDFIMKNGMEWWRGNAVKYLARAGSKPYEGKTLAESEIIDLQKAKRMIEMRIEEAEGE